MANSGDERRLPNFSGSEKCLLCKRLWFKNKLILTVILQVGSCGIGAVKEGYVFN